MPERDNTVAVELSAGGVRAIVARREGRRLRVSGRGEAALPEGAVSGGLALDVETTAVAVTAALGPAERGSRPLRVVVAIDGDDVRTYHLVRTVERIAADAPIGAGEAARVVRDARLEAQRAATRAADEDPALRGLATTVLRDDVAGRLLDGRGLGSLVGYHGRSIEIRTDVSLASAVVAGAALATLERARRQATAVSGVYALARLLAESGVTDGGILRLGVDLTSFAVVRAGRVVATRSFALGRSALLARDGQLNTDARVWAECVTAPLPLDGPLPGRWHFVGVPESLQVLPRALGALLGETRGEVEIAPLIVSLASLVFSEVPLHADDLVAAGAAALETGVYGS